MMAVSKGSQHQYQYLLFGSVTENDLNPLLHRLRGLCDYATTGGARFTDREITYKIESGSMNSKVRVRQSMDSPDAPWHLIYTGQVELSGAVAVRTCVISACGHNLLDCLKELGFVPVSEMILRGYVFRKDQMKVAVFKLLQPGESGDADSAHVVSPLHLVELSAIAPSGQDSIATEMKALAENFKPIVTMEKTDGLR